MILFKNYYQFNLKMNKMLLVEIQPNLWLKGEKLNLDKTGNAQTKKNRYLLKLIYVCM